MKFGVTFLITFVVGFQFFAASEAKRISVQKCEEYSKVAIKELFIRGRNITKPDCPHLTSVGFIIGGEKVKAGEFAHMAAIAWKDLYHGTTDFKCGGSLISERFVLTAGHCKARRPPSFVRLGAVDLMNKTGLSQAVDYGIEKVFYHPNFTRTTELNDIALIKLKRNVRFDKKHFRPACLQESLNIGDQVLAAGWGKTSDLDYRSDDLMKVKLNVVDTDEAYQNYANQLKLNRDDEEKKKLVIFAGLKGKDTCNGDSGGPIMVRRTEQDFMCMHSIVGITSYGPKKCGSEIPGVYTRVSAHLDWIESVVWG